MNKYIWRSVFVLTLCALIMSCSEDLSVSYLKLEECIREAESLITNTQEGIEEGNIAPGSKKVFKNKLIGLILFWRIRVVMRLMKMRSCNCRKILRYFMPMLFLLASPCLDLGQR